MRRRKSVPFSGRHRRTLVWVLLAAALLLLLASGSGCMAQHLVWSARGTMFFLPAGNPF